MHTESRWAQVSAIGGIQLNWFDSDMHNMPCASSTEEIAIRGILASLRNTGSRFRSVRVRSCLVETRRTKPQRYICIPEVPCKWGAATDECTLDLTIPVSGYWPILTT